MIETPEALAEALARQAYLADEELSTAAFLALKLGKPLLIEGVPGVGKTEAARVLAAALRRKLIRLQCYEGIDANHALYEWNYPRQLLAIRKEKSGKLDLYADEFLIERPLLAALRAPGKTVLLIDEIDRADHEFEALLARIPFRFPDFNPRARHVEGADAAGRHVDLEPHPRPARGFAPALRLSLDQLSRPRNGSADRHAAGAACRRRPRRMPL